MPHKLQFHVVHASGEDDVHKAGDLNHHGPLANGWHSSRYVTSDSSFIKYCFTSNISNFAMFVNCFYMYLLVYFFSKKTLLLTNYVQIKSASK